MNDERKYITRHILNSITNSLLIAIVIKVLYSTLSTELLMYRDYIFALPSMLLLLGFIRNFIKDNPMYCYRFKSIWSVMACSILILAEVNNYNGEIFLYYILSMSIIPLLINPHKVKYQTSVCSNVDRLNVTCGNVDTLGEVFRVIIGFCVLSLNIPILALLFVLLLLESIESYLDLHLTEKIFNHKLKVALV